MFEESLMRANADKKAAGKQRAKGYLCLLGVLLCVVFFALCHFEKGGTTQYAVGSKVYVSVDAYLKANPSADDPRSWLEKQSDETLSVFCTLSMIAAAGFLIAMAVQMNKGKNIASCYVTVWNDHIQGIGVSNNGLSKVSFNVPNDSVQDAEVDDKGVLLIQSQNTVYRCPVEEADRARSLIRKAVQIENE